VTKRTPIGVVFLVMYSASALGQEKPMPKEPRVSVTLSFSVEEYDPSTPSKAVIKCVVRNDTDEAIQVPVGYDANRVRLESSWEAGSQRPILSYANKDPYSKEQKNDVKLIRIEPGKGQVVFDFPLDDILFRGETKGGSLRWDWPDWQIRFGPPRSPIFRRARRDDKFDSRDLLADAFFYVRLKIGARTLTSNVAHLKIKQPTVSVALSLSSDEFDPSTPSKAVMKCVVRNGTPDAIQVPVGYDGKRIRLESTSRLVLNPIEDDDLDRLEREITDFKRKITAADDPEVIVSLARSLADAIKTKKKLESQVLIRIESGKERVVFEFPLDEILLHGKSKDGAFQWGWSLRPAPPKSPIYRIAGSRDLVGEAWFTVRLKTGGQTVDSNQVRLIVKSSD
jgi:hypothetical protein